jgi:hypothetical protein
VAGWVWAVNINPLVDSLAALVGYRIDDRDRDAVAFGLAGTNSEKPDGWYSHPLAGTMTLTVELATDPGTDVVSVSVRHPGEALLKARIETVIDLLARYRVAENNR